MGKRFDNVETFYNQEVEFNYEGKDLLWVGYYGIRNFGEEPDWSYPGDQETEITILETEKIEYWSEELENWVDLVPTDDMLEVVKWEIEKKM